jgi:general secretion pathway protein G
MDRSREFESEDDPLGPGLPASDRRNLAVIAVMLGLFLALIATGVAGKVRGALAEARVYRARYELKTLEDAVAMHRVVKGRLPGSPEELAGPPCYGPVEPALDPWGRPYEFTVDGGRSRVVVRTLGADGLPGGEGEDADIEIVVAAPPAAPR